MLPRCHVNALVIDGWQAGREVACRDVLFPEHLLWYSSSRIVEAANDQMLHTQPALHFISGQAQKGTLHNNAPVAMLSKQIQHGCMQVILKCLKGRCGVQNS